MSDIWEKLKHQSLGRTLNAQEVDFASALERIFISGEHDFAKICEILTQDKIIAPLSAKQNWNIALLTQELAALNASLDEAYTKNGLGA
jgi:hypothetical protein